MVGEQGDTCLFSKDVSTAIEVLWLAQLSIAVATFITCVLYGLLAMYPLSF